MHIHSLPSHQAPVVRVENLSISYATRAGPVHAVRHVSFDVHRGEILGLVGESGCGKSTVAFGMVGYLGTNGYVSDGDILFQGQSLVGRSPEELRQLRGDQIAMVYQDPLTSLNPVLTIGEQMAEILTVHRSMAKHDALEHSRNMLQRVQMPEPEQVLHRYPHQISGGQQQRVIIAMALLNNPALLVMDEPTTALDVTVEATVLDLVADLRRDFDTAMLFISHNLGVIARICDRVAVMYAGEIVELASVHDLFANPQHPYTQGLLRSLPQLGRRKDSSALLSIPGRVPAPDRLPPGCVFEPRCPFARSACRRQRMMLRPIGDQHRVRCMFAEELRGVAWPTVVPDGNGTDIFVTDMANPNHAVLDVTNLKTYYQASAGSVLGALGLGQTAPVRAVDNVSMSAQRGRTLGIVGESGCGKSTLVRTIIGLEHPTDGTIEFLGIDVTKSVEKRTSDTIREMQMVFQNPDATLNPSYSVGIQIARPLKRFGVVPKNKIREEVIRLLRAVKLDEYYYDRLPRQLSGGEKQRVGIARALAGRPDLVLCDEPVSALDVSVQAAVLNLLSEIQERSRTSMLFIAHDLSVVRYFSDDIAVMYLGQIVDIGPAERIYEPPYHPYTESLLAAVPIPDPTIQRKELHLEGTLPSPRHPPQACRFHTRCPRRMLLPDGGAICAEVDPPWQVTDDGQRIRCHIPLEQLRGFAPVLSIHHKEEDHAGTRLHATTPSHD